MSRLLKDRDIFIIVTVDDRATNSTAIEAIQTLLRVLCYLPAGSNEAIRGLCKTLAGLLLASAQQLQKDPDGPSWLLGTILLV